MELKKIKFHVINFFRALYFENIVCYVSTIKPKYYLLFAILAVTLGFILNSFEPMPNFIIKGPFGFILLTTLLYSLNYFKTKSEKIKLEFSGCSKLFLQRKKFTNRANSNSNYIACIIMPIFFCFVSIKMNFVAINPIGIYSLICLFGIVFLAFIAYQQYIFILLFLLGISRSEVSAYNRLIPDSTRWFSVIASMSEKYKNLFFILGSFFIILFILFSPYNTTEILFFSGEASNYFWPLLLSWAIIFFAIVILFPVSALARNILLSKVLQNMKTNSIEYYSALSRNSKGTNLLLYMDIISRINKDVKLPQSSFASIIPTGTTIFNFSSIVLTILVELKDLGYLF